MTFPGATRVLQVKASVTSPTNVLLDLTYALLVYVEELDRTVFCCPSCLSAVVLVPREKAKAERQVVQLETTTWDKLRELAGTIGRKLFGLITSVPEPSEEEKLGGKVGVLHLYCISCRSTFDIAVDSNGDPQQSQSPIEDTIAVPSFAQI